MTVPRVQRLADADTTALLERAQAVPDEVLRQARTILADVRAGSDEALRRWTASLDQVDLEDPFLAEDRWDVAADQVPDPLRRALQANADRIDAFHRLQARQEESLQVLPGVTVGRRPVPHDAVACYVPGGRATYPSTVLMTVLPARIAGVRDVLVVTPPRPDGTIDPAVAYAARIAGATRILRAGGAQAVAAVAYGTDRVPAVQAVVGPGNAYVTAAKQQVAAEGRVWTDAPAGPSELLVLADASADADAIALDLLAQAEHDPDAQVVLVTDDAGLAEAVRERLQARLPDAARRNIIAASLRDHGALLVADDLDAAIAFADVYAPEHLAILTKDPEAVFARIHHAGSVFLGPHTPVSLGDYGSGTNHVLPTMGAARIRGGLGLEDFRKWVSWQQVTRDGLRNLAPDIVAVARAEGLHAHADAVEERL